MLSSLPQTFHVRRYTIVHEKQMLRCKVFLFVSAMCSAPASEVQAISAPIQKHERDGNIPLCI